jgi:hypothetical protein
MNPLQTLREAMGLPQRDSQGSRVQQNLQETYQRILLQLKHKAEQDRIQLEANCQKLLDEQVTLSIVWKI